MGKVLRKPEVVEGTEGSVRATVVGDVTGLIEVQVGMALQVVERETVYVQFPRRGVLDNEITFGFKREILDFIELVDTDISPEALTVFENLSGEIGADAWDGLQGSSIGRIEYNMFATTDLRLVVSHHRVMFYIRKSMAPLIGRVAIDNLGTDIDRPLTVRLLIGTVSIMFGGGGIVDGIGRNESIGGFILPSR